MKKNKNKNLGSVKLHLFYLDLGGFFWRTVGSLTAQDKQVMKNISQNIKTVVDHTGNNKQY